MLNDGSEIYCLQELLLRAILLTLLLCWFMTTKIKKGLKLFSNTCGFQLVFHLDSKLIHLTRMTHSGKLITISIINGLRNE